ncbi:AHH domain-containing protein [Vibrio bivalvicida]|uniref:AHH domain-containing protein n=1 Tax=Vibrio bivalvicida TaxID=1276888 RepID=A0ABV4MCP6_9VIBR
MGYREAVLDPVENDPNHPISHGIKMSVHHLLSQQGFIISKKDKKLISYGYNINVKENLVALPSEMDAACYLRVQVHRGNHPGYVDNNDSDDDHPKSYHKHIANMLRKATKKLEDKCATGNERTVRLYSIAMLSKISNFEIPLTKAYKTFEKNESGCGGETSCPTLFAKYSLGESRVCNRDVDHKKFNSFKQVPYKLEIGR